jgi:hypothetical protein
MIFLKNCFSYLNNVKTQIDNMLLKLAKSNIFYRLKSIKVIHLQIIIKSIELRTMAIINAVLWSSIKITIQLTHILISLNNLGII